MKKVISLLIFSLLWICAGTVPILAENSPHLYSTGNALELDRCASAWLIKRFVDPLAEFRFFPDGEFITQGMAFDTPDAKLYRTHNRATFEVIMEKYEIKNPKVMQLAGYIHDIEINFWGKKQDQESVHMEMEINQIIRSAKTNEECLQKCFIYFDRFLDN